MRVVRLTIPGSYEDAWVYKDHLLAWTTAGELWASPLGRLVQLADIESTDVGTVVSLLFTRNDWKASALFRRLVDIRTIESPLDSIVANLSTADLTFPCEMLFTDASETVVDGTILDVNVYADHLYLSTTEGFFDSYLSWDGGHLTLPTEGHQRLDTRTVASSVGYGLVNASCEEVGLFTSFDEFGWREWRSTTRLERTDDLSFRTSWVGSSLLNYRGVDARLFHGETERVDSESTPGRERRLIVEYGAPWNLAAFLHAELAGRADIVTDDLASVRLIANVGAKLVAEVNGGRTILAQLIGITNDEPRLRSVRTLPLDDESVLSVARLGAGIVLEAESAVLLWDDEGITELLPLPAVRVRTFPNSIRYRDMVLVVAEHAMYLIGTYGPSVDLPPNRPTRRRRGVD